MSSPIAELGKMKHCVHIYLCLAVYFKMVFLKDAPALGSKNSPRLLKPGKTFANHTQLLKPCVFRRKEINFSASSNPVLYQSCSLFLRRGLLLCIVNNGVSCLFPVDIISDQYKYEVNQNHSVFYLEEERELYVGGTDFVIKLNASNYRVIEVSYSYLFILWA